MTNQPEDEFFRDLPETTDLNAVRKRAMETFKELIEAQEQLDQTNEIASGLNAKIGKIKSDTFPSLLDELGTDIWRDPETGISIELETVVNSKLPKNQERRNEILAALRPIGIEEILGEEFNLTFIPNDRRTPVIRRLLGIQEPMTNVLEDDEPDIRLTNEQIDAIERFREAFELGTLPAEEKLGVHPSRLSSWLKKRIADGKGTEVRDAGIWHGKAAKVVLPKGGK